MRQHEHGRVKGSLLWPANLALVEHPATHDVRAGSREDCPHDVVVGARLSARAAGSLAERREAKDPVVNPRAAVAKRIAGPTVRSRDETVERHADVDKDTTHGLWLCV